MERKIGERFEYNGTTLEVVQQSIENKDIRRVCKDCYFYENLIDCYKKHKITGECSCYLRIDGKEVIFKEVQK